MKADVDDDDGVTIVGPIAPLPADRMALARRVVALHHAAYTDSDPLPGLPTPDGATEDPVSVAAGFADGDVAFFAIDRSGRDLGVGRLHDEGERRWRVHRFAVPVLAANSGVTRRLCERGEAHVVQRGGEIIAFDAVVERGRPQIWARRGYRATRRWPSDDKPLTEVTMERHVRMPITRFLWPWEWDGAVPSRGILLTWHLDGETLIAIAGYLTGGPVLFDIQAQHRRSCGQGMLLGADVWPGGGSAELDVLTTHLASACSSGGEDAYVFSKRREDIPLFLIPRSVEPRLVALWRFGKGRGVPVHPRRSTTSPSLL